MMGPNGIVIVWESAVRYFKVKTLTYTKYFHISHDVSFLQFNSQ